MLYTVLLYTSTDVSTCANFYFSLISWWICVCVCRQY